MHIYISIYYINILHRIRVHNVFYDKIYFRTGYITSELRAQATKR